MVGNFCLGFYPLLIHSGYIYTIRTKRNAIFLNVILALFCGFAFNTDAFDIIVDIDMSRKNKYQIFQNTTLSVKDLCDSTMSYTSIAQCEDVHLEDLGISKISNLF